MHLYATDEMKIKLIFWELTFWELILILGKLIFWELTFWELTF